MRVVLRIGSEHFAEAFGVETGIPTPYLYTYRPFVKNMVRGSAQRPFKRASQLIKSAVRAAPGATREL